MIQRVSIRLAAGNNSGKAGPGRRSFQRTRARRALRQAPTGLEQAGGAGEGDGPVTKSKVGLSEKAEDAGDENVETLHLTARQYKAEYPEADQDAVEVNLAVLRTQRTMTAAITHYIDSLDMKAGVTGARYSLMRTLYFARDRRLVQNEIGRAMGVSRTNITNLIDGLERDGLVRRISNPADRRVSHAQLTPAGEETCRKLMAAMVYFMDEACSDFTPQEKVQFAEFLHRFRHGLERRFLQDAGEVQQSLGA
jgi:DNA-binding MarR family transcriptional regulator